MMGNDRIESDAFTAILDMAHSDEFKVIIKEYSDLLTKLSTVNNLTPQELAALIYFANERLSASVSMTFTFHSIDFMGDQNPPSDISRGGDSRGENLVSDLLTRMDQIPDDGYFPKVLSFFLEHPMHAFDVSQIAKYLDISKDDVKKNLDLLVGMGYVTETEEKDHYKLKRSKETLQTLSRYLDEIAMDFTGEKLQVKICNCQSSPPGILLEDGTCGNCDGVVAPPWVMEPMSDFYKESMEKHYGLRICPVCGHENRHPSAYCDKCKTHIEPLSKWTKCPQCGEAITKGRRSCDHCHANIPPCYGVKLPRTQDCTNCIYTKKCLEEQSIPIPVEELTNDPEVQESIRRCREEPSSKPWRDMLSPDDPMMETWDCPGCGRVELIIYLNCLNCGGSNPDVTDSPVDVIPHPKDTRRKGEQARRDAARRMKYDP